MLFSIRFETLLIILYFLIRFRTSARLGYQILFLILLSIYRTTLESLLGKLQNTIIKNQLTGLLNLLTAKYKPIAPTIYLRNIKIIQILRRRSEILGRISRGISYRIGGLLRIIDSREINRERADKKVKLEKEYYQRKIKKGAAKLYKIYIKLIRLAREKEKKEEQNTKQQ